MPWPVSPLLHNLNWPQLHFFITIGFAVSILFVRVSHESIWSWRKFFFSPWIVWWQKFCLKIFLSCLPVLLLQFSLPPCTLSSPRICLTFTDLLIMCYAEHPGKLWVLLLSGSIESIFRDSRISSQYMCCHHFSIQKGWSMLLCYSNVLAMTQTSTHVISDSVTSNSLVKVMHITITVKSKRKLCKGIYHDSNS